MVDNIAQAAAGIHGVTKALSDIRGDMYNDGKAMIMQVRQTAAVTATLAKEVTQLTQHLDELVGQNKQEINRALLNLAETSRRLKETAEALQHDPSELIWGRRLPEKEIPDK